MLIDDQITYIRLMKRSLLLLSLLSVATFVLYARTGKLPTAEALHEPTLDKEEEPSLAQGDFVCPKQQDTDTQFIHHTVEVKPEPGFNLSEYLVKHLLYPEAARENKVQGRLTARFVVEKDGSITNIKVIKGAELQNGLPEEVIRVISSMPKWVPGKHNGQPVRVYHTQPFTFSLQ